jgi:hypothetical protein
MLWIRKGLIADVLVVGCCLELGVCGCVCVLYNGLPSSAKCDWVRCSIDDVLGCLEEVVCWLLEGLPLDAEISLMDS